MNKHWNDTVSFVKNSQDKMEFELGPFEGKLVSQAPLQYLIHVRQKALYYPKDKFGHKLLTNCINYRYNHAKG